MWTYKNLNIVHAHHGITLPTLSQIILINWIFQGFMSMSGSAGTMPSGGLMMNTGRCGVGTAARHLV
jgi:hypothetical protein